jgi:hypothetical protein
MGNLSVWHTQADVVGDMADRTSVCLISHWRHGNNHGTAVSPASHRCSPVASVLPCQLGYCVLEQAVVHEEKNGYKDRTNQFACHIKEAQHITCIHTQHTYIHKDGFSILQSSYTKKKN